MEIMVIKNDGIMEQEAFTMMGLSTKREDFSKIGMFGTGNKYAIAVLLREGFSVGIYTPKYVAAFDVKKKEFRGKEYEQIVMTTTETGEELHRVELGITTDMGLQWTTDHAMREFICNARDEGGFEIEVFASNEELNKKLDSLGSGIPVTYVIVKNNKGDGYLTKYAKNFDTKYLFYRNPLFSSERISVYEKLGAKSPLRIYRNGVLVLEKNIPSVYDYELNGVDISESRDTDMWQAQYEFSRNMFGLPESIIQTILESVTETSFEALGTDYYIPSDDKIPNFLKNAVILTRDLYEQFPEKFFAMPVQFVPENWYKYLRTKECLRTAHKVVGEAAMMPGKETAYEDLGQIEKMIVDKAVDFVSKAGYNISVNDLHFKELDAMGMFRDGKIYISTKFITRGVYELVNTLVHEIMHRESRAHDATCKFEDYLIHEIVKQLMVRMKVAL